MFGDVSARSVEPGESLIDVKTENINAVTSYQNEELYYGNNSKSNYKPAGRGGYSQSRIGRNQPDKSGQVTRCAICGSLNHWASACLDVHYFQECSFENQEYTDHQVTLF